MTIATRPMTLEEYLDYDDGTETRYELVNGELVEMPTESSRNIAIVMFLLAELLKLIPHYLLKINTEIAVSGRLATTRIPDLMILTDELAAVLQAASRSIITHDMPPPALVVEVVSPGSENQDRDYRYKRSEYAARGIAEYWIVDPQQQKITVLTLAAGLYEEAVFQGTATILSPTLPTLQLTAEQILAAGQRGE